MPSQRTGAFVERRGREVKTKSLKYNGGTKTMTNNIHDTIRELDEYRKRLRERLIVHCRSMKHGFEFCVGADGTKILSEDGCEAICEIVNAYPLLRAEIERRELARSKQSEIERLTADLQRMRDRWDAVFCPNCDMPR